MTKVKLSPLIAEISGTLGDVVFRKTKKKGEAILCMRPKKSKSQPSQAQMDQWDRFSDAAAYAQAAREDPEVWAHYEAEAERLDWQPHIVL